MDFVFHILKCRVKDNVPQIIRRELHAISLQLFSESLRALVDRGLVLLLEGSEITINGQREETVSFLGNLMLPFVAGVWVSGYMVRDCIKQCSSGCGNMKLESRPYLPHLEECS